MKRQNSMLVTFVRIGERRYAVQAAVEGKALVETSPAPGYDSLMPHDLQHFIVERVLGIEGGVFGQLAAGGTAGSFHIVDMSGGRRSLREGRKRAGKQSKLKFNPDDPSRSERAAYICSQSWFSQSSDPSLRAKASEMQDAVRRMLDSMPADERALYTEAKMNEVRTVFDRLSVRWSKLKVGESFTEPW